ncbi:MAG: helix-turn-helix domain-containing protein [Lactobacillus sp.]|nr:helix-turn-helix domain-containing protein [Lactobacillus sp.]MCI1481940.1 helix-turn-helix domain-containing protein [Lactobacillus sp.]
MNTEYLTFKQARQYLSIKSPKTLRAYIKQGLPVITVGKSKKISKAAIDAFMTKHQNTVAN